MEAPSPQAIHSAISTKRDCCSSLVQSLTKNRPFHGMFRLSDHAGSGLVTLDAFRHTLNMLGARLTQDEAQIVTNKLTTRTDGLVDYEGLYRLLLNTPPPQVTARLRK